MSPFVLLALAYGAGATPTSFWLGRVVYGVDLRTEEVETSEAPTPSGCSDGRRLFQ